MKSIYSMALATVLFVAAQASQGHPVGVGHAYADDPRDDVEQASYEDCVGDYHAAWEGKECDWVRYMHPSYQQENTNE